MILNCDTYFLDFQQLAISILILQKQLTTQEKFHTSWWQREINLNVINIHSNKFLRTGSYITAAAEAHEEIHKYKNRQIT